MKSANRNIRMLFEMKMTLTFTGVAGINTWLDYRYNFLDFEHENDVVTMPSHAYDMWDNTIRVKNHMNGNDVINTLSDSWGDWSHGMDRKTIKKNEYKDIYNLSQSEWSDFKDEYLDDYNKYHYSIEMQYYVSSDDNQIVGYVRNRTFNLLTKSIGGDCDSLATGFFPLDNLLNHRWNYKYYDGRLKVENLKVLKTYDIDFYGEHNGTFQHISYDSKLTSAVGKLKLRYPELQVEESWQNRPVIWFVAKREGYNGMRQNNDISEDSTDVFLMELLANEQDPLFQESSLKVYPNPFDNFFTIDSPISESIIIQELSGKVIKRQKISKGKTHIQTGGLMKGVYFIRFLKQSKTFKIVKQ